MPHLVRRHHLLSVAAVLTTAGLALTGCSSTEVDPAPDTSTAPSTPSATDSVTSEAPTESLEEATPGEDPGPYSVGRRTEQVVDADRDGRTLAVEVWYPSDATSEPTPYELIPGVSFASPLSTVGSAPSADGPFPVVVFSHGSGGLRQQSASIVETIASHGFVVVAPDHPGNTAIDQLLGTSTAPRVTATNRVLDIGVVLDRVESGELAGGLADAERIAVMGHSFGGFTALAAAGGYDGAAPDSRVDAVVPLAPFSEFLSDSDLSSITVPLLVITGSDDRTTPVKNQSTRPVNLATGESELVLIDGGEHQSITDICAIGDAIAKGGDAVPDGAAAAVQSLAGGVCEDRDALAKAFDITEHYSVAFLRSVLLDDTRYDEVDPIEGATVQ